jgi:bifunctional non-homologous end joining protein LigD
VYAGNCGTGFNSGLLKELHERFRVYFTYSSPFREKVKMKNKEVQWMEPKLVCEVKFTEWTEDGSMRHPVFLGMRKDKGAKEVQREMRRG